MEKLALAINEEVNKNNWLPVKVSKNGPPISHLLFADDVLFFVKAKNSQVRLVKSILEQFSMAARLKINVHKSKCFASAGVPRRKLQKLGEISGISFTTNLGRYLGFPMVKGRAKKDHFSFVIDKLQTRLASWKSKLLNKAGRLTLTKSVLSSIPTYNMQINWFPQGLCNTIDKCMREFLWKGSLERGIHLVNWQKVTRFKSEWGLGIRAARLVNISLLGKLVWDMENRPDKPWVQILSHKYLQGRSVLDSSAGTGSNTW